MVRIKVFKASQLLYWAVIIVVAVALIGLIANTLLGSSGDQTGVQTTPQSVTPETVPLPDAGGSSSRGGAMDRRAAIAEQTAIPASALEFANEEAPPMEDSQSAASSGGFFSSITKWLLDVDLRDPASLLMYHLPLANAQTDVSIAATAEEAVPGDNELPGDDDVGEHIRVEIARITEPYRPATRGKILIYHTHTYEAYEQDDENPYVEASAQWRTKEEDKSIVGIGNLLAEELTRLGYEVVHDKTEFEPPRLGTAYERSLIMLQERKDKGEEYAMTIDLHRDAWDKLQQKQMTATLSDGSEAARLMMLIGTGEGSEGNSFSVKPNWKENYKLADALTNALNDLAPGLCRDVLVKTGRYNQHISDHSVLIEIGNNRNTLEEAESSVKPLASAIHEVLSGGGE